MISSANYHDMAAASSNWGGTSQSIYANRWNSVAPANEEVGCGVGIYGANAGNGFAFWAPHYPIDPASLRFGISWNFYD